MREHRIFGAPGTGKTTELVRQVNLAIATFGEDVVLCSFTKAAAEELHTRRIPLPRNRIATLHSLCRSALDGPQIAEKSPLLADWNATHSAPWKIDERSLDDPYASTKLNREESRFSQYDLLRHRMLPRDQWDDRVMSFALEWEEWKQANSLADFTDLIQHVLDADEPCPFPVRVLFADEAQDYSALELAVVRMWGASCDHFVLAGDDQQCIYGFKGATPDSFLHPAIPDEQKTILNRSYRLPEKIRDFATEFSLKASRYEKKEFLPNEPGGDVIVDSQLSLDNACRLLKIVEEEREAERSVMLLASCSFMLQPVIATLRRRGLAFHNPYRVTKGAWNPLRGVERLKSFLRSRRSDGQMRWGDVWPWFEFLSVAQAGIPTGAKALVKDTSRDEATTNMVVTESDFKMLAGIDLPPPDIDWLRDKVLPSKWKSFDYGIAIVERYGIDALKDSPRIVVGTIHSVKGGEADTVIVFPDLSGSGVREMTKGVEGFDSMVRLFYVAMTRAKKRLVLARPKTHQFMKLWPTSVLESIET